MSADPVQVRELAFDLDLPLLATMAEAGAVREPWEGATGQVLQTMLQAMLLSDVNQLLHSSSRSAVSELEVREAGYPCGSTCMVPLPGLGIRLRMSA